MNNSNNVVSNERVMFSDLIRSPQSPAHRIAVITLWETQTMQNILTLWDHGVGPPTFNKLDVAMFLQLEPRVISRCLRRFGC